MKRKTLVTAVTVLLLVAIALPVGAQTVWTTFTNLRVRQLSVTGAADVDGTLNVDGASTLAALTADSLVVSGNGDVTGNFEVADHLLTQAEFYMIPPAAVTVTDNGVITPTGAVVELTAAGSVAASLLNASDGQFLILINTANQTITISETATAHMAGDFAMGQWDTISFIGQGVVWNEIARSNN